MVASYNRATHLERALDSVASQTFAAWECLVCDDASTDGSPEVVRARAAVDRRFRLVAGPHAGLPAAPRNRGITEARAEWVAFLDDDDAWHPRKLERQAALAHETRCDAVSVRTLRFVEPEIAKFVESDERASAEPVGLIDVLTSTPRSPVTSATMVRRSHVIDALGFCESAAYRAVEDFDLWCRLFTTPGFQWVADMGAPLVAYREQGEDSISSWHRVIDPDVIRQRWAILECMTRTLAAARREMLPEHRAAEDVLIQRADDCGSRCRAVGWRAAAANAYHVAGLVSLRAGSGGQAAVRFGRAARVLMTRPAAPPTPVPEAVPLLARRSLTSALRMLTRTRSTAAPIEVSAA